MLLLSAQVSISLSEEFAPISRRGEDKSGETESLSSRQLSAYYTALLIWLLYVIMLKG